MNVSINLRTDISKMYEYQEATSPINITLPKNVDVVLDTLPLKHPFIPRISPRQAHMFIWWGTKQTDPDIYDQAIKSKNESQWFTCKENWKIEKGIMMLHIYEKECIIGGFKYAGYMRTKPITEIRFFLKSMMKDMVELFKDKTLICPTGSYFEYLHLTMNQKKIQHEPYHKKLMRSFGFKKHGNYWIKK